MTVRAVVLGLLVSVVLASLGYVNDVWFFFSYIGGDLVPIHAFGLLLLALMAVNPLLRKLRRWHFKASELVTMLAMALMGSTLAGSAFYWQYPHPLITPIHEHATNARWESKNFLQYVPPEMMVDAKPRSAVVSQYMRGIEVAEKDKVLGILAPFSKVPWHSWVRTMAFWSTVLGLSFLAGLCAVLILHRQWSKREQLSYPIATFTEELLRQDDRPVNPIFRNRIFWIGFAISFVILMINGYQAWNSNFISVPTTLDCRPLTQIMFFKDLARTPGGGQLLNIRIFFAAVGLAYFLSSEASFSMGISGLLFAMASLPLVMRGVNLSGGMLSGGLPSHMWFGAYLGMGIVLLYLGRRFYGSVFKRAFFLPASASDVLPRETWAARILIVACIALVALLWKIGLHPVLGIAFVLLSGLLFIMMARLHVATGLFLIQPSWHPVSILLGLFGGIALGPSALAILALLCTATTLDPRIAAVPLAANVLKLAERNKLKPGFLTGWMCAAIIVSLVLSLIFTVWLIYSKGAETMDETGGTRWALKVTKFPFEQIIEPQVNELEAGEILDEAKDPTTLARLWREMKWSKYFFHAVGIGVGLVLVCSYLRLRFPHWPLHPLMFLVWGQPWMIVYAPSFLLGWLLKSLIMKYGGQRFYYKARPLFIGLVAAEFLAAIVWAVVGVVYYLKTGTVGESFLVRE